jgi:hypothetical protein
LHKLFEILKLSLCFHQVESSRASGAYPLEVRDFKSHPCISISEKWAIHGANKRFLLRLNEALWVSRQLFNLYEKQVIELVKRSEQG